MNSHTTRKEMNSLKLDMSLEESCFGTVTVGERGQIVIPSDARKQLGINSGDKLFIAKHPMGRGLVIFKIDSMRELFTFLLEDLDRLESLASDSGEEPSDVNSKNT